MVVTSGIIEEANDVIYATSIVVEAVIAMTQSSDVLEVIGRMNRARALSDQKVIWELLSEDCQLQPAPSLGLGIITDRERIAEVLSGTLLSNLLGGGQVIREVRQVVANENTAVVVQGLSGYFEDGTRYENEYVWIYSVCGGAVVGIREYTDTLNAARAGLIDRMSSR